MLYREIIAVCSEIHTKHINTLCGQNVEFLGAFAKFRKATVYFVMSVRPSAWNNLAPTGRVRIWKKTIVAYPRHYYSVVGGTEKNLK